MTDDDVCTNMETRPAPVELLVAVLQPGLENLPKIFTNVEKNIQIYIILSKKGKISFFLALISFTFPICQSPKDCSPASPPSHCPDLAIS